MNIFEKLRWHGYRCWGNGAGYYWVFAEFFYPGYTGYMGQFVGYGSLQDLRVLLQDIRDLEEAE